MEKPEIIGSQGCLFQVLQNPEGHVLLLFFPPGSASGSVIQMSTEAAVILMRKIASLPAVKELMKAEQ